MITFYYGVMGSGKSVYSVNRIYNNFSEDKKAKKEKRVTFNKCYTNIVQFKFDKVKNVYPFDFDEFYKLLVILYAHFKAKKDDDFLQNICKEHNILNTLFVIDEAQNHFDIDDKVLVWWLTYHRHLNHEIMIIAPDASLINLKYRKVGELVYVAKSRLLVLDKRYFKYNVYCSYKMTAKTHNGSIKIKSNPKVFELYKSGDSVDGQNIVLKYILISILISFILFLFIYFVVLKHDVKLEDTPVQKKIATSVVQKKIATSAVQNIIEEVQTDHKDSKFIKLSCTYSSCTYKEFSLPPQIIRIYIDKGNFDLIYKDKKSDTHLDFYISTSKEFYSFIFPQKKEFRQDEEDNNNLSIFGSQPTSK